MAGFSTQQMQPRLELCKPSAERADSGVGLRIPNLGGVSQAFSSWQITNPKKACHVKGSELKNNTAFGQGKMQAC